MNFTNQTKQLADKIDEAMSKRQAAKSVFAQVKMTTAEMTDRGVATVNELTTTTLQPSLEVIQNASQSISNLTASAVGFTTSSVAIADALKDLPKIADELAREMPKIRETFIYG